jgi:DNA-directed RNA polymerase subunit H (RpoH/RPB5)
MRLSLHLALIALAISAANAQLLDRMVAVVNKHVILESELDQEVRVEYLMQGKPLDKISPADSVAVLDHLVDRALLEQQILHSEMLAPTPEELAGQVKDVRQQLRGAATDAGWKSLLAAYDLTQQDIEEHLIAEVRELRFVDLRFRGLVRVDKNDISNYYQQKFLPQLRSQGAAEPPLAQVSGQIEKILAEQSIDEMLNRWLETLRAQAHIEKMIPVPASTPNGSKP